MTALRAQKSEFWYSANLTTPAFRLFTKWGDLAATIVSRLSSFGAGPESLVFESPSGHPKDFILACHLPSAVGTVRFRLKSVEVWMAGAAQALDPSIRVSLISEAYAILAALEVDTKLDNQTLSLWCHGELAEGTFAARIAEYVGRSPSGMDVAGVTFRKDLGAAGQGFIDLQPSYALPGPSSVFFSVTLRGPGGLPPDKVYAEGVRLFEATARDLALEPDWSTLT